MPLPLGRWALLTCALATGSSTLAYYIVQTTFSRSSYYQSALEQLHNHPTALEALGAPLSVHRIQLLDKHNLVDIADAQLKIPVSGSKSEGHLYVSSSRDAPFQRWKLREVFLEVKGGEQIPIFKFNGENGDEVNRE